MLFHLLEPLAGQIKVLNVVHYITFRTVVASMTAFAISLFLGPWLIRTLRLKQIGQVVRNDGPESHKSKAGTPTMGGLLILAAVFIPTLLWANLKDPFIWIAVVSTAGFGAIGFADDYLKIARRNSYGLFARYKMAAQLAVAFAVGVAVVLLARYEPTLYNTKLSVPFFKHFNPDVGLWYVPFTMLVLVACSNTVNLTDGLDGLAISTFAVAASTFTAFVYVTGHAKFAEYLLLLRLPVGELTIFCGSLVGASLGFLWWNA
ncbi:MAG: phospho-N-acetylmuramoyl-pentapeptide-transferase, partial [Acidobacteria bacterium]